MSKGNVKKEEETSADINDIYKFWDAYLDYWTPISPNGREEVIWLLRSYDKRRLSLELVIANLMECYNHEKKNVDPSTLKDIFLNQIYNLKTKNSSSENRSKLAQRFEREIETLESKKRKGCNNLQDNKINIDQNHGAAPFQMQSHLHVHVEENIKINLDKGKGKRINFNSELFHKRMENKKNRDYGLSDKEKIDKFERIFNLAPLKE